MKWTNIAICVALFLFGIWIGSSRKPAAIVIERRVNYWDMTELTEEKVEVAANFFNKTLQALEEIQELHQRNKAEINKIYDTRRNAAQRTTHISYQQGYIEGYRDGRLK